MWSCLPFPKSTTGKLMWANILVTNVQNYSYDSYIGYIKIAYKWHCISAPNVLFSCMLALYTCNKMVINSLLYNVENIVLVHI